MSAEDAASFRSAVRRHPGMYVGDVRDGSGLLHMVYEVLANSLDQFLAGKSSSISITLGAEGTIAVEDDGEGISIDEVDGVPFSELVFTRPHFTPTRDGHKPHEHISLHGVGLCAINALCEHLELRTRRNGLEHVQSYRRGEPQAPLRRMGSTPNKGTLITFLPDPASSAIPG
ncbi:MAG: hypothetical protein HOW73_14940 [Polyangiaceae bacterium]|nr:hypothetical protein [Polyangiaceae bacterium]